MLGSFSIATIGGRDILGLLKKAVEAGYSGYTGPSSEFLRRRPHFNYLKRLDENYEKLVSEAVGIAVDEDANHKSL